MKKVTIVLLLLVIALGSLGFGTAYAQGQPPTVGFGSGIMHEYLVASLADKLGMSEAEINQRLLDGETMYEIVQAAGITVEDIPEYLADVRTKAFAAAVADGVITQDWADRMTGRMQPRTRNGTGNGTCVMDGTRPQDGTGQQFGGRGMMGGGGRGMRGTRQHVTP